MGAARRKLGSEKGAAITFALLIFLVCSLVSVVVLVAATAASGRLSGIGEMDQRYYSVTSAAEFFRDSINGKSVEVTKTKTEKKTESWDCVIKNGKIESESTATAGMSPLEYKALVDGTDISTYTSMSGVSGTSILKEAAVALLFAGSGRYDAEENYGRSIGLDDDKSESFTVTVKNASSTAEGILPVSVTETIKPDGSLVFIFKNAEEGAAAGKVYTLTLAFEADVRENISTDSKTEPVTYTLKAGSADNYTASRVTTDVTTKTTTITWRAVGLTGGGA